MKNVLEIKNLSKAFGAVVVADELSFSLSEGEALGVIGPNGAGKTSVFNLITGTLRQDFGYILFEGNNIENEHPSKRCHKGLCRSFQIPQPFGGLSVFENTFVAATQGAQLNTLKANSICIEILEQTGLISKANDLASSLTLLERKRLELARSLSAKPKVLLLDEIAGGLTENECLSLVKTINEIKKSGVSIIWIEHIVHALLSVVDRLIVINFGKKIADGNQIETMKS
jgi:branched-chain amino acid transport system ATP-binding protein